MDIRHLRCFVAVAEELHFARAAERLHMEQSPLSRAIKDLEYDVGARLLERTTRSTRLTWAGQVFLDEARRVLVSVEQAKASARAAAAGCRGRLRIGLSDGLAPPRLSALLAQCREEEPEVEIRLFEMPFAQQVKGLRGGLLDAGLAMANNVGEDLVAEPVWTDPVAVIVPARHALLAHRRIPLGEALRYPLILCHPEAGSGCHGQLVALLKSANRPYSVAEHATSLGTLLTLVGAGYGIGFAIASQASVFQRADVVVRPLAGDAFLTTFLLRPAADPSKFVKRFAKSVVSVRH